MKFWILSPNVYNDSTENLWKESIANMHRAFIGYKIDHKYGLLFRDQIQIGDIILIAQGQNSNKRLFLCGEVSSAARWEHLDGTPGDAQNRQLINVLTQETLQRLNINFNGSKWGDSKQPATLYHLEPQNNASDLAIQRLITSQIQHQKHNLEMEETINLLKYKKQIILQGPPGTGKTKLAKEIAYKISLPEDITMDDIRRNLSAGIEIESSSGRGKYKIVKMYDDKIEYHKFSTEKNARLNFVDILTAFSKKIWLNKEIKNGSDSYSAAFAKYIYDNFKTDQVSVIQFHPAYSYEDFVRGISVKNNGNNIEYQTLNKTIATLAQKAYINQTDFEKDERNYSYEIFVEHKISDFADYLSERLINESSIPLTTNINITDIEENAFVFRGENWYDKLKFDQIKKMLILDINSSIQLKNTPGFAKTVYHRRPYYMRILELLKEWCPEIIRKEEKNTTEVIKKNYVLIIDEINRANLPSVLGELIYALEYRDKPVNSMYDIDGDNIIVLSKNLFIIGTMNTSDRSVGHIDYAIRRRFAFVDILPKQLNIENFQKEAFKKVSELFIANYEEYMLNNEVVLKAAEYLTNDFRPEDVWLGHSYFIATDEEFIIRKKYEIIPILKEYIKDGILKQSAEAIINTL